MDQAAKGEILAWLGTIYPLWEQRYSERTLSASQQQEQRWLLRPVYWLGNWQFACLDYYHPPHGVKNRCVRAESFPPVLARLARQIEALVSTMFHGPDLPSGWELNTCLVNFYGSRLEDGKMRDIARVGEHKDFEPGPVASISLGERAFFQFVSNRREDGRRAVEWQQWLDDGSLQIFGGERFKNRLFHRVQRVDDREKLFFKLNIEDFKTRRVNFTFRYVPKPHIVSFAMLPRELAQDVSGYVQQLAIHSRFFAQELKTARLKGLLANQ